MNIIIDGIEPQFKVYQMTESIENKTYIGSNSYPLKCRMSGHINSHNKVDMYFADVGWNNVIVQIIGTANNKDEMRKKRTNILIIFEMQAQLHCSIKIKRTRE